MVQEIQKTEAGKKMTEAGEEALKQARKAAEQMEKVAEKVGDTEVYKHVSTVSIWGRYGRLKNLFELFSQWKQSKTRLTALPMFECTVGQVGFFLIFNFHFKYHNSDSIKTGKIILENSEMSGMYVMFSRNPDEANGWIWVGQGQSCRG